MAIYRPPISNEVGESSVTPLQSSTNGESNQNSSHDPSDTRDSLKEPACSRTNKGPDRQQNNDPDCSNGANKKTLNLSFIRNKCGSAVNHPRVQLLIIILIVINAIMMGIATFDFVTENPEIDTAFEKTDTAFLVVFTIELAMQLIYLGLALFMDGWLLFDFVIVVVSWSFSSLQIIRAFRIFRALRIITRIETMRNLVTALFDIMPRLGAITALLLLIFYIFAVLFTQLFGDLELSGNYFSRLDYSLFTLFVMMTMEWADVARECMAEVWWAWAPFIAFIMITGFIVFNLIIAVVCDAVAVIENKSNLEPDIFGGDSGHEDGSRNNEVSVGDGESISVNEEELMENLSERIAFVLSSQREMHATLELLTRDFLTPVHDEYRAKRRFSLEKMGKKAKKTEVLDAFGSGSGTRSHSFSDTST